jgi:hypothetical protein
MILTKAPDFAATKADRVPVTAQFAYDHLCDVTLYGWTGSEMDPWITFDGGMDKIIERKGPRAGKLILCYGSTGEAYVDPSVTVYCSTKAYLRALGRDKELEDTIAKMPKLNQRQYDTQKQVLHLITAAHKLGLYDAADVLRRYIGN